MVVPNAPKKVCNSMCSVSWPHLIFSQQPINTSRKVPSISVVELKANILRLSQSFRDRKQRDRGSLVLVWRNRLEWKRVDLQPPFWMKRIWK